VADDPVASAGAARGLDVEHGCEGEGCEEGEQVEEGRAVALPTVEGELDSLKDCIASKVRRWRFPSEVTATATWSWTLELDPP